MRPIALPGLTPALLLPLALALGGCGDTWWNPPFSGGFSPNTPVGDSDNMRRVMGEDTSTAALQSEPGDIWPGPLPPSPTLQDLDRQPGGIGSASQQPNYSTSGNSALPAPNPARGSAAPPAPASPPPVAVTPQAVRPSAAVTPQAVRPSAAVTPPPRDPAGQVVPTARGPVVTTGGTSGYQTTTTPGGGSAIIVPNGNGTSTVIHSDGRIETVPTPR